MSIHVKPDPVAEARLAAQRRNSTITSIIISFLVVVVIGLTLGFFLLPNLIKETPTIVTYQGSDIQDKEPEQKKVNTNVQRKPTSPASSSVRVIASTSASPVSIPVPDEVTPVESVEFGDGEDFGGGWGDGDGFGAGGGGATFFNQKVKADRIAYVIDYSASMRGKREELMRDELEKSVSGLGTGSKYQLIFFAGPVWVAGDKLDFDTGPDGKGAKKLEITTAAGRKYKLTSGWKVPASYNPEWRDANINELKESQDHIKKTSLVYGTEWSKPLELAMEMDPAPQIIFFMTDGTGGTVNKVKELATKAKRKGIVINSIAMMMPSTADAMGELANGTGGVFTIIDEKGKAKQVTPKKK